MKPTIKRILVPTDFSIPSEEAVDYAAAIAARFGATVHLIHVVHDPMAAQGAWEVYLPDSPHVRETRHRDAKDRLWSIASSHETAGVRMTSEVRFGSPMEEILAAATAYGCDLIVMGTHGRTGLPHLLLGSIAERVIRTAPCPVLAVRQQLATTGVTAEEPIATAVP